MRCMVIVKGNKDSEAGIPPSRELVDAMMKFNEEMVKAGILLAGDGLQPTSKGAKIRFSGSKRTVIDGPFTESKEVVAGFWIIQVKSKEEAIEWMKRCPSPFEGPDSELEIRPLYEMADFPAESISPETAEREQRIREELQKKSPQGS